jgi:hypothetical protein
MLNTVNELRVGSTRARQLVAGLVAVAMLLGGCATQIPDLKPFADATRAMNSSVDKSMKARVDSLGRMEQLARGVEEPAADGYSTAKVNAEAIRRHLADAIDPFVEYADGLRAIADKGKKDSAAADEYAKRFSALVKKASGVAPFPGAAAIGAAGSDLAVVASRIAQDVIREKTRYTLIEEVSARRTAADELAVALSRDIGLARDSFDLRKRAIVAVTKLRHPEYRAALKLDTELNSTRAKILDGIDSSGGQPAGMSRMGQPLADLAEIERVRAFNETRLKPFQEQVDAEQATVDAAIELLDHAQSLVQSWRTAHAQLPEVIDKDRRSPLEALSYISDETQAFVKQLREAEAKIRKATS